MASRFVLTAQVQLQAPTNTRQVVNQIQQQLRGVNVQVNLQGGQQAAKQVNNLNKATKQATTQADKMGKAFGASIRRFGAFTIATRAVSLFTNGLANATKEAIDFEREMVKISQVTGKTIAQLKGLENTITGLATSLGVSSKSILSVGRILSQAGIQAKDLNVALTTLAKTSLAPTFDDITKTAEGAVAILAQFGEGVGALERQLGAINAVAGQFAVESGDLISAVRRTGGVFKAAGGELEELLALFTSVRATTRESAESIATGLRTIFTRIQRPQTIEFLKQFGVELTDLNGKFVGPYEAIRQLSQALSGLGEGDIRFVQIAEELGGFRQIGKVIPLLQQFETAERARQAALEGGDSLNKDAAKAQAALAVQIAKVKEEFLALVRSLTQTSSFQLMVKSSLELASALIKIADALKPLIPLLTAFAAIKLAKGAAGFARGIGAGLGGAKGFASGGVVPGTGNRDTVPAMLTPGEFVIRKSSVSKLGAGTLASMNQNGYAAGGKIDGVQYLNPGGKAGVTRGVRSELINLQQTKEMSTAVGTKAKDGSKRAIEIIEREFLQEGDPDTYGAAFLRPFGAKTVAKGTNDSGRIAAELSKTKELGFLNVKLNKSGFSEAGNNLKQLLGKIANKYSKKNTFELSTGSLPAGEAEALEDVVLGGVETTIREGANKLGGTLGMTTPVEVAKALKSANIDQVSGNIFEAILGFAGSPYSEKEGDAANAPFDFNSGLGATIAKKFGLSKVASRPTEAKSYFSNDNVSSIAKKVENYNIAEARADFQRAYLDMVPQLESLGVGALKGRGFGDSGEKQQARIAALKNRPSPIKKASGGGISGSDTVPAMLTPGEFVFNKKAAQSIGYSNLGRMNKHGVKGYAAGGVVAQGRNFYGDNPPDLNEFIRRAESNAAANDVENLTKGVLDVNDPDELIRGVKDLTKELGELDNSTRESNKNKKGEPSSKGSTSGSPTASSLKSLAKSANENTLGAGSRQTLGGAPINSRLNKALKNQPELPKEPKLSKEPKRGGMGGAGFGLFTAATSLAAFVPKVEGATEGIGAMQNEFGNTIMQVSAFAFALSELPLNKAGKAAGVAAAGMFAVVSMVDAYTGVHERAKKAIEEGDVANAGQAAVASQAAKDVNKLAIGAAAAGATIGTAFGPVGTVIGGLIGAAAGLALKFGMTDKALEFFRDNILTLFGGQSTDQIAQEAKFKAELQRETKLLAEASKLASEELKKVKAGDQTIGEAFKSGNLTKGFAAVSEGNKARIKDQKFKNQNEVSSAGKSGIGGALLGVAATGPILGAGIGIANSMGADVASPAELGDEIGAYLKLWPKASERTKAALIKAQEVEDKTRKENNKKLAEQLKDPQFQTAFNTLAKSVAGTAAAMGTDLASQKPGQVLNKVLEGMGPEAKAQVEAALAVNPELRKQFEQNVKNMAEAAQENAEFLKSLNFGLKDVTSGITTFNNSLDNIATSSKSGFNSLTIATNTLSAVVAGAGATISKSDLDSSLNTISSSFAAFGATESQIKNITGTISGFNDAQKNANSALNSLKTNLAGVDLTNSIQLNKVQDNFQTALLDTIPNNSPIKEKLKSAFNGVGDLTKEEIEQFLATGDASPILEKAFGPLGEQIEKQIIAPSKEMEAANSKLIKATEERRLAELKLIAVQKQAIDIQIEASKNLEFFGGAKFTPEKEFSARKDQANLSLADAGIRGLTGGSASDIRRASQDVFTRFSGQQQAQNIAIETSGGTRGAFADRAGLDADRRPELKKANEALLTITKQGIEQRKQELDLIKKKNQAEKDALDSLLGGNIEEFFEKSSAAAAGSALRSGNAAAASLFSASSLGKGLQGLQGTGISDAQNKRAADLTFGAFGLGGGASEVFTGTTPEEEKIKAEGRELSKLQGDLASQMGDMETMDVTAKQVIINTQDAKFSELQNRVNQNQAALGFSGGGTVYANRGMFIPRGTDTVPAMLTPGEFVVNRAAVQRGNNLQMLRSMNSNSAPTQATQSFSSGGPVRYRANGSTGPEGPGGVDFSKFEEMVNKFQEVTDKLGNVNIKHMFEKLGTLDINHMFNGNMQQAFKDEILTEAGNMMSRSKFNGDGSITTSDRSVLG